ncbi:MAG TPA: hypothetical protein VMV07_24785, partial [Streptosporangiaceae bacterium]|nr:hypothetical protein [Streptosporangiaceae bacterium]
SAAERRQIIDDFTAEVFRGLDPSPARAARWAAAPDLPDDPSAEQVEARRGLVAVAGDVGGELASSAVLIVVPFFSAFSRWRSFQADARVWPRPAQYSGGRPGFSAGAASWSHPG